MKKSLQVNDMLFKLEDGEEITAVRVGFYTITIEGFTPWFEFITTYYMDKTVSKWRGFGNDVWTEDNCNIIAFDIVED